MINYRIGLGFKIVFYEWLCFDYYYLYQLIRCSFYGHYFRRKEGCVNTPCQFRPLVTPSSYTLKTVISLSLSHTWWLLKAGWLDRERENVIKHSSQELGSSLQSIKITDPSTSNALGYSNKNINFVVKSLSGLCGWRDRRRHLRHLIIYSTSGALHLWWPAAAVLLFLF